MDEPADPQAEGDGKSRVGKLARKLFGSRGGSGSGAGDGPSRPASDEAPEPSTERMRIAERVRFWEEQDRINEVLIPRVLRMHELVVELGRQVDGTGERIAHAEARAREQLESVADGVAAEIRELREAVARLSADVPEARVAELQREARISRMLASLALVLVVLLGLAGILLILGQ